MQLAGQNLMCNPGQPVVRNTCCCSRGPEGHSQHLHQVPYSYLYLQLQGIQHLLDLEGAQTRLHTYRQTCVHESLKRSLLPVPPDSWDFRYDATLGIPWYTLGSLFIIDGSHAFSSAHLTNPQDLGPLSGCVHSLVQSIQASQQVSVIRLLILLPK